MEYTLEKRIWTDADFEQMGWHDCRIYSTRLAEDLALDIDYIIKWNKPELEGLPFTFWVAPATLVFKRIKNMEFDIDTAFSEAVEIDNIERVVADDKTTWVIDTQQGFFEFECDGYEQFIRQEPFYQFGQTIPFIERNGSSLERTINQVNTNRQRDDVLERRKKGLEDYENAQKRHVVRQEKEALTIAKENNEIDLKAYLIKKREITEKLEYYDYWLNGTDFEKW